MSYAALLKGEPPASASTQPSARPHTPSQPGTSAPTAPTAQPSSPTGATPLPPRASGNRNQGRHPSTAPQAGADTSGKGDQRGGAAYGGSFDNKAAGNNVSANGPPARPPYSAPGRGPAQGYRDDESSKKAVFVRNVPQVTLGYKSSSPEASLFLRQHVLCNILTTHALCSFITCMVKCYSY